MTKPTVCAVFAGLLMFAVAPQVRAGDELFRCRFEGRL
jgi:hypothetical protein